MTNRSRSIVSVPALVLGAGLAASLACAPAARGQLRVCTWNVTNYTSANPDSRNADFRNCVYGIIPAGLAMAGQTMSPDVIVATEFLSQAGITQFLGVLNTTTPVAGVATSPADWAAATFLKSGTNNDTYAAFFYRTGRVQFLGQTITAVGVTGNNCEQPRDTIRYDFRPLGYAAGAATMSAYSIHLKAQGSNAACPAGENAQGRRLLECQRIRDNAEGVNTNGTGSAKPAAYHALVAGDTNIQNSTAVDYVELVGSQANNTGRFFDPIATTGTWNNNSSFRWVHTQDPRSAMDDRHDQILTAAGLIDLHGLEYQGDQTTTFSTSTWNDPKHTYRSWGNDGSSYDGAITRSGSPGNTFVGNSIATSLFNSVTSGGGHLPVVAHFLVPPKVFTSVATIDFGTVDVGSVAQQSITISNSTAANDTTNFNRWGAAGINGLYYTLALTSGFTTPGPGTIPSRGNPYPKRPTGFFGTDPGAAGNVHVITMDTSTPGTFTGTLTITAPGATEGGTVVINITGTVQAPNTCPVEYNGDGVLNPDDIGDFITDYYTVPVIPGPDGYAIACPENDPPYDLGYKTAFTMDGSGQCFPPNPDNLGDYITRYYEGCGE